MKAPEIPEDEQRRLAELRGLSLLDTPPEERFDRVTRLARHVFDVPVALFSLVDEDRQWFKSKQGLDTTETPREISFCGHAITGDDVFVVADARHDERFSDNPLVSGDPHIRFYAGRPVSGPGGSHLGTLCVIDRVPRELDEADLGALRDLAAVVEQEVSARNLANVDELTGIANRRGFDLVARKLLELSRRKAEDATLLSFDLVGLKRINETFGHDEGDRALTELAHLLRDACRVSDVVGRIGGDEFVVLLPGAGGSGEVMARVLAALRAHNRVTDRDYRLDASIGSSVYDHRKAESLEELLRRAATAMDATRRSATVGTTEPALID